MPKSKSTAAELALRPSGGIVMRTPRLPRSVLDDWSSGARNADRETLRAHLRELVTRPDIREAIYVASPSLESAIDAWIALPTSEEGRKTERGLVRYLTRMTTRSTPFGLFAGNTVGELGDATRLELGPVTDRRRYTRVDGDYLSALCDALARVPGIRARLSYHPNTSLCNVAGRLRYAMREEGGQRSYSLISVEPTMTIVATLERARRGARSGDLVAALCDRDADITHAEAEEFIEELIAGQLLVPDLAPSITGVEAIDDVITQLEAIAREHGDAIGALAALSELRASLRRLDAAGTNAPDSYRKLADILASLPVAPRLDRMVQVNLETVGQAVVLGRDVVDEALRTFDVLHRMSPSAGPDELTRFREAFLERYDTREVELVEVLDEETGIGFGIVNSPGATGSPLFDGIAFPAEPPVETVRWAPAHIHLAQRIGVAIERGHDEVVLDADDIAALTDRAPNAPSPRRWPDASYVLLGMSRTPDDELRIECVAAGGPPGATLLGRFAHGSPAVREVVAANVSAEARLRPGVVFAEIAHLPDGRLANIVARPVLRSHEIVYLARSGAAGDDQIDLTDLMVSVRDRRVLLRSRKLDAIVEPRLTTAHNVSARSLGPYRFLAALQHQDTAVPRFEIGPLAALPHVPRIRLGRVILRRESWILPGLELATLAKLDDAARAAALNRIRSERRLPRWVAVEDGDNVLSVDLDNPLLVDSFLHLVKSRDRVMLVETPQSASELVVTGEGGRYAAEVVLPLVCTSSSLSGADMRKAPLVPAVEASPRRYVPDDEWLYVKFYTGKAGADRVLVEALAPLVTELPNWFFVRYGDPGWHVRLRVRGDRSWLVTNVLPAVSGAVRPLLDDGTVWKVQLDTYEREVERYGGRIGVGLAERLFHADSVCVLGLLAELEDDTAADTRWCLAALGIERLLDDFALDLDHRHTLLQSMRHGFAFEYRADASLRRSLGDAYRGKRTKLDLLFHAQTFEEADTLSSCLTHIAARSAANGSCPYSCVEADFLGGKKDRESLRVATPKETSREATKTIPSIRSYRLRDPDARRLPS